MCEVKTRSHRGPRARIRTPDDVHIYCQEDAHGASGHQSFDTNDLKALVSIQLPPLPCRAQGRRHHHQAARSTPSFRMAALHGCGSRMPCDAKVPNIRWGGQLPVQGMSGRGLFPRVGKGL